jgi:hypothetical protein
MEGKLEVMGGAVELRDIKRAGPWGVVRSSTASPATQKSRRQRTIILSS